MATFNVQGHVKRTDYFSMLVAAETEEEAKAKAKDFDYIEYDDVSFSYDCKDKVEIDEIEVAEEIVKITTSTTQ